ncbi:MAG: TolC family protein [Alphaproteobacteria bacterium]|nr:TolC family protein [Alphaproteobacteria bacterium]
MRRLWAGASALLLLSACATYRAQPLDSAPEVLAPPVAKVLQARADRIDRPWLKPVTVDLAAPLTGEAVAVIAVVNNPDLKAQRVRAGVSDAQVFAAGLLPDPTISLGASKVLSGPDPLVDLASSLAADLNALRTAGVARRKAKAEARQVRLDLAWAEWQTAGQARIRAVRVAQLERIVALDRQSRDVEHSLLARIQRAAGRGDVSGDRLQAARTAAFDAANRLRTAEKDLAAAREDLDKLLGLPPGTDLAVASPAVPAEIPSAEALFALARDSRTDLAALRAGYAAQEAAVHKAVLDQFPTLNLTMNANRDSAGNLLVGPAVDFTLPIWNRNRGGIAVERATRAALKAEYDARLFQTRADIGAAVAGIRVAFRQREEAMQDLPEVRRHADAAQRAAKRGDLSLEAAQNAEQVLRDRLIQIAQSEQDLSEQTIALELLTGAPREAWPK